MNSKNNIKLASKILLLAAGITLLAAGCNKNNNPLKRPEDNTNQTSNANANSNTNTAEANTNSDNGAVAGSMTPLPTKKINVAGHELNVEVADNDTSREQGLSGREKLDDGNGMLFDFTNTNFKTPGFWMKDMLISIDIVWINNGKVIGVQANAPLPPQDADLPVYSPPGDVTHVLEVPAGWYKNNNIKIGDSVQI